MLKPDELKPYLLHEDQAIRDSVVEYFADAWSQDESLVPLILQACDRFGEEESLRGLSLCSQFPITEQALVGLFSRLLRSTVLSARSHLNRAIATGPIEYLTRHEKLIAENPHLLEETMKDVQRRRDFIGWSGPRLWEELQVFAEQSETKKYVNDIDHDYADAIIEALAPHDVPDAATICRLLKSEEESHSWFEIFLIELAGERRLHEAIPILVDKFRIDGDYLLERSSDALAKIGSPETVHLIREAFPSQEWSYRLFTASLLGKIKATESEDAIVSLLDSETDRTIRANLCFSLCKLFSSRGVEIVEQEIKGGNDSELVNLEEELLPVIDVLGIDLPDADEWRDHREEQRRRRAQRLQELDKLDQKFAWLKKRGIDPLAGFGSPRPKPEPVEVTTYRRQDSKVGRNDLCPCGSGKKYKKCCERK